LRWLAHDSAVALVRSTNPLVPKVAPFDDLDEQPNSRQATTIRLSPSALRRAIVNGTTISLTGANRSRCKRIPEKVSGADKHR